MPYWADPHQKKLNEINHWDDGRGVYFEDPNGHLLEILTRSYGSTGTSAEAPHPLVAERLEPKHTGDGPPDDKQARGPCGLACSEQPHPRRSA